MFEQPSGPNYFLNIVVRPWKFKTICTFYLLLLKCNALHIFWFQSQNWCIWTFLITRDLYCEFTEYQKRAEKQCIAWRKCYNFVCICFFSNFWPAMYILYFKLFSQCEMNCIDKNIQKWTNNTFPEWFNLPVEIIGDLMKCMRTFCFYCKILQYSNTGFIWTNVIWCAILSLLLLLLFSILTTLNCNEYW